MTTYWCEYALLPTGLARSVRLTVGDHPATIGTCFVQVEPGVEPQPGDVRLTGLTMPGFANTHSHAFHRALRGRTHDQGGTFWTWRERMYHVAAQLDPENYLSLARATYAEMARAGITSVGEFHYVHHNPGGTPYDDPNEMGKALQQAALDAGVGLTLLDTCYLAGGLGADGHTPLSLEQLRFGDGDAETWGHRVSQVWPDHENFRVGTAAHSVRAVPVDQLQTVAAVTSHVCDGTWGNAPLHVHVSEQPAENEACLAYYGRTPVRLLADSGLVDSNLTAVHATHLTDEDIRILADARAYAGFCPTTERDLADGIGPAKSLADSGVAISLGSDQHAVIDHFEEVRAIEMHERLVTHERGRFTPDQLLTMATRHDSIGWGDAGRIESGKRADFVTVALDSPRTAGSDPAQILFSATAQDVRHVVRGGEFVVQDGQHRLGDVGQLLNEAIAPFWENA